MISGTWIIRESLVRAEREGAHCSNVLRDVEQSRSESTDCIMSIHPHFWIWIGIPLMAHEPSCCRSPTMQSLTLRFSSPTSALRSVKVLSSILADLDSISIRIQLSQKSEGDHAYRRKMKVAVFPFNSSSDTPPTSHLHIANTSSPCLIFSEFLVPLWFCPSEIR